MHWRRRKSESGSGSGSGMVGEAEYYFHICFDFHLISIWFFFLHFQIDIKQNINSPLHRRFQFLFISESKSSYFWWFQGLPISYIHLGSQENRSISRLLFFLLSRSGPPGVFSSGRNGSGGTRWRWIGRSSIQSPLGERKCGFAERCRRLGRYSLQAEPFCEGVLPFLVFSAKWEYHHRCCYFCFCHCRPEIQRSSFGWCPRFRIQLWCQ